MELPVHQLWPSSTLPCVHDSCCSPMNFSLARPDFSWPAVGHSYSCIFIQCQEAGLPRKNDSENLQRHFTGGLRSSLSTACIHPRAPAGCQAVVFQRSVFPVPISLLAQLLPQGAPGAGTSAPACSLVPKYRASLSTPLQSIRSSPSISLGP